MITNTLPQLQQQRKMKTGNELNNIMNQSKVERFKPSLIIQMQWLQIRDHIKYGKSNEKKYLIEFWSDLF